MIPRLFKTLAVGLSPAIPREIKLRDRENLFWPTLRNCTSVAGRFMPTRSRISRSMRLYWKAALGMVSSEIAILGAFLAFPSLVWAGPNRIAAGPKEVEAIYIINFCRFTTWPVETFDSPTTPVKIGIWGDEELARLVKAAAVGETIHLRPVEVERVDDVSKSGNYQLVFVSDSVERVFERRSEVARKAILFVGDSQNFVKAGGHIQFVNDGAHIKLRVNLDELRHRDLEVSSNLLRIAEITPSR